MLIIFFILNQIFFSASPLFWQWKLPIHRCSANHVFRGVMKGSNQLGTFFLSQIFLNLLGFSAWVATGILILLMFVSEDRIERRFCNWMRILYSGVLLVLLQLRSPLSRSCYYYFCLKTESVFLSFSGLYSLQDDEFNPCPRCPCRQRRIKACEQHKHLKLTEYFGVVEVGDISSNELGQSSTNHKPPSNWK